MNKKLTLTALSLTMLLSTGASSEVLFDTNNPTDKEKIESLIVSSHAFKNKNIDKIILFRDSVNYSCKVKELGMYTFADIEGGNVNRLKKYPLASASESLLMDSSDYKNQLDTILGAAKNEYCLDVALAPMIDVGYTNRSYFLEEYQVKNIMGLKVDVQDTEGLSDEEYEELKFKWQSKIDDSSARMHQIGFDRINTYLDSAHESGLKVSLKHYPLSFFPDSDHIDKELESIERSKWQESKLVQGYSEILTREMKHKNSKFNDSLMPMKKDLIEKLNSQDMIMLSSYQFDSTDYVPYVASRLPQIDPVLKNFNGLLITDDLYQLNLEDNDISNIFLNSDLFIITSTKDLNTFTEKVLKLVSENSIYKEALNNKYNKVQEKLPRVRVF